MRKVLLLTLSLFVVFTGMAFSQVIADFEDAANGTMGFIDGNWGAAITSIGQVTDPTGRSAGVLEINFDAAGKKDPVFLDGLLMSSSPHLISYDLYLPSDCPDNILFKIFTQDGASWKWQDVKVYARDIPKEVWYPVYFNLRAATIDGGDFSQKINRLGIEFQSYEVTGEDTTWTGKFYMDNVALVGAEPKMYADFEDPAKGTYGFVDGNWGSAITAISQATDPSGVSAGVLQIDFDASGGKDPIYVGDVLEAAVYPVMSYDIWLPADCPDSVLFKVFSQDGASWKWQDIKIYSQTIPKETWYPLVYSLAQRTAEGGDFTAKANRLGIEFQSYEVPAAQASWTGIFYIDNVQFLGSETGKKWVVADFEKESGGTLGFSNTYWGAALTGLSWASDPSGQSIGVLKTDWDFNLGTKGAFEHGNVNLGWDNTSGIDTGATAITFDVWVPAGIPGEGSQLSIFVRDHNTWTWTEEKFSISDSTVIPGQWNTISYPVIQYMEAGQLAPWFTVSVGVQLFYSVSNTWTGNIYFDNFTLIGIEEPEAEVVSPMVTAEVLTATGAVPTYQFVRIEWIDNTAGTESYNVYMSEVEITDLTAPSVTRLTNNIPHGEGFWIHRPWSKDGSERTYYYAVTAITSDGTETEITGVNVIGPITLSTSVTAKAVYDAEFASKFVLDGLDNEFVEYEDYKLYPESAGGVESAGWTVESTDMSWAATFVIDDKYLYISADVTDDDLNAIGNEPKYAGTQPWMGDALEFFIGYYNVNLLEHYHNFRDVDAPGSGDWRIAFTAWGTTGTATNNNKSFPGVEATVYQKFTGDGYIIEARITLDSLAMNNHFEVVDGAMMPMQINGNDLDPDNGDEGRTLQANWGTAGGHQAWLRPGAWGFLEVLGGPSSIDKAVVELPKTFELLNNYPNPFNPITNIRFQLPKTAEVTVIIFDILGNKVRSLESGRREAGVHTIQWDGTNDTGQKVTSGIYFCKFKADEFSKTQKMMLIK